MTVTGKVILDRDVISVLDKATIDGTSVVLNGELARDLYVKVNKALEAIGGKWDRKAKAHLFDHDPEDAINNAILTGSVINMDKALGFFETPPKVADMIIDLLDIRPEHLVLEPSAGKGAIIRRLRERGITQAVQAVEIDTLRAATLRALDAHLGVYETDFLHFSPGFYYDRIAANPPFVGRSDIFHVAKMWDLLMPRGGRLCSVMPSSVKFRRDSKALEFLDLFPRNNYDIIDLPEGAFKVSGTMVNTVLFLAEK